MIKIPFICAPKYRHVLPERFELGLCPITLIHPFYTQQRVTKEDSFLPSSCQ